MQLNKRQVWSETSCLVIAQDLRKQAEKWERRAAEIKNFRGNHKPIDDVPATLSVALRGLAAHQNGMDGIQICIRYARRYGLDFDSIRLVFDQKKSAWDREQRKARNRAMIKMSLNGKGVREIARIFELSPSTVSRIIKPPIRPTKKPR